MKKWINMSIALPAIITIAALLFSYAQKSYKYNFITGDSYGYYAYLPTLFYGNDFSYNHVKEKELSYFNAKYYNGYLNKTEEGKDVNKYFSGVALLSIPFFFVAHILAPLFDYPQDGYSAIYQVLFYLGAIFYFFLGLVFLSKTLKNIGFSNRSVILTIVFVALGTHLFYYSFYRALSHVFSFSIISAFFCLLSQFQLSDKTNQKKLMFLILLTFGLICIVRPTNGLVLFIVPFFIKDFTKYIKSIISIQFIGFLIPIGVQLLVWKILVGKWIVFSYANEGFYFSKPFLFETFLGPNYGLFLYTPMLLISLVGFAVAIKQNKKYIYPLLVSILALYIISAWWCWGYLAPFSIRPAVDMLPILALPMAFLLEHVRYKKVLVTIGFVFIFLNIVNTIQVEKGIISASKMTYGNYAKTFLKLNSNAANLVGGCIEPAPFGKIVKSYELPKIASVSTHKKWDEQLLFSHRYFTQENGNRAHLIISYDILNQSDNNLSGVKIAVDSYGEFHGNKQVTNAYHYLHQKEGEKDHVEMQFIISPSKYAVNYSVCDIYLLNEQGKKVTLENFSATINEYSSK